MTALTRLLSFRGRSGRGAFLLGAALLLVWFFGQRLVEHRLGSWIETQSVGVAWTALAFGLSITALWLWIFSALIVRRMRDANFPAWAAPVALLIFAISPFVWPVLFFPFIGVLGGIPGETPKAASAAT